MMDKLLDFMSLDAISLLTFASYLRFIIDEDQASMPFVFSLKHLVKAQESSKKWRKCKHTVRWMIIHSVNGH